MTPEEMQVQQMMAAALRGEQMRASSQARDADVYSAMGGTLSGYGDKAIDSLASNAAQRGQSLAALASRARGQAFDSEQDMGKFRLTSALQARREASARQQHLSDIQSQRGWQEGRDAADRAAQIEAAKIAAGQKVQETNERDVQSLAGKVPDGAAGFWEQSANIRRIVSGAAEKQGKTIEGDSAEGVDIPGVGKWDSMKPGFLQSNEGLELQKYAGQMMLAYQNLVTGSGGGEKELAKIAAAGADLGNERGFMKGLRSLEDGYAARLKQVKAGFRPEVVKTYEERMGGAAPRVSGGFEAGAPVANKDRQALQWAMENPEDPRSKTIVERLRGKK